MSVPVNSYTCLDCGLKVFQPGLALRFTYQTDNVSVPINYSVGWCHACNGFAPVEVFDSPDALLALEEQLAELRHEQAAELAKIEQSRRWWQRRGRRTSTLNKCEWQLGQMGSQALELRQRLSLLAGRHSPPRCLQCGSTDAFPFLTPLRFNYASGIGLAPLGIEHPGCGGDLAVMDDGTRMIYERQDRLHDAEGNRIAMTDDDS